MFLRVWCDKWQNLADNQLFGAYRTFGDENLLKALFAACAMVTVNGVTAGIVQFEAGTGQITGINGIDIDQRTYDVEFVDGTCIAVFSGCDELSDFPLLELGSSGPLLGLQALYDEIESIVNVPGQVNSIKGISPDFAFIWSPRALASPQNATTFPSPDDLSYQPFEDPMNPPEAGDPTPIFIVLTFRPIFSYETYIFECPTCTGKLPTSDPTSVWNLPQFDRTRRHLLDFAVEEVCLGRLERNSFGKHRPRTHHNRITRTGSIRWVLCSSSVELKSNLWNEKPIQSTGRHICDVDGEWTGGRYFARCPNHVSRTLGCRLDHSTGNITAAERKVFQIGHAY